MAANSADTGGVSVCGEAAFDTGMRQGPGGDKDERILGLSLTKILACPNIFRTIRGLPKVPSSNPKHLGLSGDHLLLLAALYLLLLLLSPLFVSRLPAPAPITMLPAVEIAPVAPADAEDYPYSLFHVMQPGESLAQVFRRFSLSMEPLMQLLNSDSDAGKQLSDIQPGDSVAIETDADGHFRSLLLDRGHLWQLKAVWRGDELTVTERHRQPLQYDAFGEFERTQSGTLLEDAKAASVPEPVLEKIVDLLNWSVDLGHDSKAGDQFLYLYKEQYLDGDLVGYGPITALEYRSGDGARQHSFFRYQTEGSVTADYYDESGNNIRKAFLRRPLLGYYSISSPYDPGRKHPLQHTIKAHTGVDYAAKVGTEVSATGAGQVIRARASQSYGNLVVIRHDGGYETRYGHLNDYARNIVRGTKVEQGQVIGYVGTTGYSTGPHLHYEFRIDGQHVDPHTADLPTAPPVPDAEMPVFDLLAHLWKAKLELCSDLTAVAALEVAPLRSPADSQLPPASSLPVSEPIR